MHRWIHLLAVIAFFFVLSTGGAAHAAEQTGAVPVAAESIGHFAGDKDQVPADRHKGVPHHHSICGDHAATAWSDWPAPVEFLVAADLPVVRPESFERLRHPDSQLRPPIA